MYDKIADVSVYWIGYMQDIPSFGIHCSGIQSYCMHVDEGKVSTQEQNQICRWWRTTAPSNQASLCRYFWLDSDQECQFLCMDVCKHDFSCWILHTLLLFTKQVYIYEKIAPNDMHINVIYIAYATDQGLSSHDATVIMAILSTSSFVGRVFIGWVVIFFSQWHMLIITTGTWVIALDVLIRTCYACLWAHLAACCFGCLLVLMAQS